MKRILSMFLLLCMVCGMLTACPAPNDPNNPDDPDGSNLTFIDSLGDRDYDGAEFVVSAMSFYDYEVYAEEGSSDVLEDQVFRRNRKLENRFNCKIVPDITLGDLNSHAPHLEYVQRICRNNEEVFDIAMLYVFQAGNLIPNGYLYDLRYDVPYVKDALNNGSDWWSAEINAAYTVHGSQYVGVSDYCVTAMQKTYVMVFNKNMVENENLATKLGYTDMYDMVRQGGWTMDVMRTMVKGRYADSINGGTANLVDDLDTFGLVVDHATSLDQFAPSLGVQYVRNDGESTPELMTVDMRTSRAFEKVFDLFHGPGGNGVYIARAGIYQTETIKIFAEARTLLVTLTLDRLSDEGIHDMENDFGIIPYPKLDSTQAKYHSGTLDNYSVICVPSLYDDERLEFIGTMVEALSAETNNSVIGPYYDLIVTHNNTRDEESIEMLELIMDGRLYDLATLHYNDLYYDNPHQGGPTGLGLLMRSAIQDQIRDMSSFWSSIKDPLEIRLEDLVDDYTNMVFQ